MATTRGHYQEPRFGAYSLEGNWEEFIIGEDYEAFLITRKDNNFAL